jgi:hypothetical protein
MVPLFFVGFREVNRLDKRNHVIIFHGDRITSRRDKMNGRGVKKPFPQIDSISISFNGKKEESHEIAAFDVFTFTSLRAGLQSNRSGG